jgi:hypothetical protein
MREIARLYLGRLRFTLKGDGPKVRSKDSAEAIVLAKEEGPKRLTISDGIECSDPRPDQSH